MTKWEVNEKVKDENGLILKIETAVGFLEQFDRKCTNMDFSECWSDRAGINYY